MQTDSTVKTAASAETYETTVRRRLARHVEQRTTDLVPDTLIIRPEVYTDPVRWEAERREIFLKMPMLACLSQDIPNPGDFMLFEDAGPSVIVVRSKEGVVNAFLNMCAHRAAKLVSECGQKSRLTCPFHAWTYNLEGKLIGVPRKEAFSPGDLANRNLIKVPVGEWAGLIFVKATPGDERIDVKTHLGGLADTVAALHLEFAGHIKSGRLDFDGNWKYALDTYGEGYHVGALHSTTVGAMYYGDTLAVNRYGPHHTMVFAANSFAETVGKSEADWPAIDFSPVHFVFPNIAINVQPMPGGRSYVTFHRVFTGDRFDKGYSLLSSYKVGGALSAEETAQYAAGHDLIMNVVGNEDFALVRGAYKNLQYAPPGFTSVFGRNEHPAAEAQRNIAKAINMPL
jgi:carnitine monooxygenase subunit